jgi:hypothetical protein
MPCPVGYITRNDYNRKAHSRKSYTRSDGTRVKGSYVNRTHVSRACVPDTGKPGKTPSHQKVLPKLGKELSFRKFGYSTHKSDSARHQALGRAAKNDKLKALRRLVLASNYQADPVAKAVMKKDVEYLKNTYAEYKKQSRLRRKSSKKQSKRKSKKQSRR